MPNATVLIHQTAPTYTLIPPKPHANMRLLYQFGFTLLLTCQLLTTQAQPTREPLFKSFDGTQIHYDVIGQGRPVLLLHGFNNTGESWKRSPVYKALVDAGFKVITLDLRGNGQSDKPHQLSAYQNDAEIKDIIGLMQQLFIPAYDVVGYSRGSIVAARLLALDTRKQIGKAVLGGMGLDFTNPNWSRRIAFYEAFAKPGSHPELQAAVDNMVKSGADTVSLKLQQQAQPYTSPVELASVKIPVLVIAGEEDADNGSAAELAEVLPNATLAQVPGTHNTARNTPEFAEKVVGFLKN